MDLSKYTKLIDKVARKVKNGSLNQEDIKKFVSSELGTDINTSTKENSIDLDEMERKHNFTMKYRHLSSSMIGFWILTLQIQKNPSPFSIKGSASKIIELISKIKEFKDDENYEIVLLQAISKFKEYQPQLSLSEEHIKVLKRKYL